MMKEDIEKRAKRQKKQNIEKFLRRNPDNLVYNIYHKILLHQKTEELSNYLAKANKKRKEKGRVTMWGIADVQPLTERLDKMYHEELKDRSSLVEKMANYFRFDKKRFMKNRERIEERKHDVFSIMKIMGAVDKIKNDPIFESVEDTKAKTDGFTYHYSFGIPSLDISTDTKQHQNWYWETALENLAYIGSKNYYSTHRNLFCVSRETCSIKDHDEKKQVQDHDCGHTFKHDWDHCSRVNDNCPIRYLPQKDKHELPTPKRNNTVYLPLHIKPIPQFREVIGKNGEIVAYRITEGQFTSVDPKYVKIFKEALVEQMNGTYETEGKKQVRRIQTLLKSYLKSSFIETEFLDRRWSIEIMSHNSMTTNASLIIETKVQKVGWKQTRVFISHLHLNPNSRALLNIELFETSIKDLENWSHAFKPLITTLFVDLDMTMFSRNASLTLDDGKIKKDVNYMRRQTYTTMAHNILRERAHHRMTCKLGQIAFTDQIELPCVNCQCSKDEHDKIEKKGREVISHTGCKNHIRCREFESIDPNVIMSLLKTSAMKKYNEKLSQYEGKEKLDERKKLNCFEHKSSNGITTQNWIEKYACSIYLKDERWYENKAVRMSNRREPTAKQMEEIYDHLENHDWSRNVIRWEITFFGFQTLHSSKTNGVLSEIKEWVETLIDRLSGSKFLNEMTKIINEWSDETPLPFYKKFGLKLPNNEEVEELAQESLQEIIRWVEELNRDPDTPNYDVEKVFENYTDETPLEYFEKYDIQLPPDLHEIKEFTDPPD